MAHNMVLMMQAIGLGGLYFGGLNSSSVMGSPTMKDVKGLGFTFIENEKWIVPNPVGLDGFYEGHCPPYYKDMREAVDAVLERKFGPEGAYHPDDNGPWKNASKVKATVKPYSDEIVNCISEVAEYVLEKYGKFPGTIPTMVIPGFVQAHHIDTEYYDHNYKSGSYLKSHAEHMANWHQD